jgi:hypothetical protein
MFGRDIRLRVKANDFVALEFILAPETAMLADPLC